MSNRKLWIVLIILFFLAGAAGGYLLFQRFSLTAKTTPNQAAPQGGALGEEDFFTLRIFYPVDNRLQMVEKRLQRRTKQTAIAEALLEEYFKGPGNGKASPVPQNVKVLGIYKDSNRILYIDLSDEVRRNFQGDALSEYMLLKGIYEGIISNVEDIQDIKILVEGKEIETLGGHLYLKYTLKNTVLYEFKGDKSLDE